MFTHLAIGALSTGRDRQAHQLPHVQRAFDRDRIAHPADGRVLVASGEVARRDVGTAVRATGVIKPRTGAEVRVGSQISGVVKHLFVHIGDTVHTGQPLAALSRRTCDGAQRNAS